MDRQGIVEGDQTRKTAEPKRERAEQNEENNGSSTADVSPIKSEPIPRASGDETTESDVESKSGVASSTSGVLMQNIEGATAVRENREFIESDESGKDIEQQNRRTLESIIRCVEFCGRQGIGLRGHRDDGNPLDDGGQYMGNFKQLIKLVSRKDKDLKEHLEKCPRNATYLSKDIQNELLRCMLKNIQDKIVDEVTQQKHGSYFGIIANVVTDSNNSKGVWIVLRYLKDKCTPVERLLGYVKCEKITDEKIVKYISNAGIDKSKCRGQICYNAGYSAGKQNGAENQLKEEPGNKEATYFHCASHQLDLFSKASKVPEAYHVICLMEKLGLFFEYSSNRQRALEKSVEDVCKKTGKDPNEAREKVKLLCKKTWVGQQAAFDDLKQLYEPLLDCLDFIERNEENRWDPKDIDEAAGINTQIRDSKFIVSFVVCHYIFGVSKDLAPKLKDFPEDTIVLEVRDVIKNLRKIRREDVDEFSELFSKCKDMAKLAGTTLAKPRVIRHQFLRNDQGENLKGYFRRSVYIPFVDHVTSELENLFPGQSHDDAQATSELENLFPGQSHDDAQATSELENPFPGQSHDAVQATSELENLFPGQSHDDAQATSELENPFPGQSHDAVQATSELENLFPGQSHDDAQATSELENPFPGQSHDAVQAARYLVPKYLAEIDEGKKKKYWSVMEMISPLP